MSGSPDESTQSKSKRGLIALSTRTLVIYVLQAASVFALSHWLNPSDYGLFALLNGWVGTTLFFTDLGVAGALVQQKEHPSDEQLASCAGLQLTLGVLLAAGFWALAPLVRDKYELTESSVLMLRILALTLPVYSLRAVPRVLCDRNMRFSSLGKIEVSESATSYVVQIGSAAAHAGAWSFVAAVTTKSVVGTALFLREQLRQGVALRLPRLSWRVLAPLLRFGLPYQANAIVVSLRGLMIPLVFAPLLNLEQVGLITWSLGLVSIPLFLAVNYNQVLFSSLSRLQHDRGELVSFASRSTAVAVLGFGFVFGLGGASAESLITLLFSEKWQAAVPIVPIAALSVGLGALRYLCSCLMNASGRPQTRLKIESALVIVEAVVALKVIPVYGLIGYFWSSVAVNVLGLFASVYAVRDVLDYTAIKRFVLVPFVGLAAFLLGKALYLHANVVLAAVSFSVAFYALNRVLDPRAAQDVSALYGALLSRVGRRKRA